MTPATTPFEVASYDAGSIPDARAVKLAPMTGEAAIALGAACSGIDPWARYGISAADLTASFSRASGGGAFRYQALVGGRVAGAMIVLHPWLIGPYLQFIAVLPAFQGAGVGVAMLSWFEARARASAQRNIWLCVSGFNKGAQGFYRAQGWEEAAVLPDLIGSGVDEIMMRKRLFETRSEGRA